VKLINPTQTIGIEPGVIECVYIEWGALIKTHYSVNKFVNGNVNSLVLQLPAIPLAAF